MPRVLKKKKTKAKKYVVSTKDKPLKETLEAKEKREKEIEEEKKNVKHKVIPLKANEIPVWKVQLKDQSWQEYPAAVSRRIEEGYQDERSGVSVDYSFDVVFANMTRVRKTNRYLTDPIKRDIEICEGDSARKTAYRPLPTRKRIFEGLRPMVASDMHLEDWTTEFQDQEQLDLGSNKRQKTEEHEQQEYKPIEKPKRELRDNDEDEEVENAVPRHCVRVGLPSQCVGSRQARKLQTILEGVSTSTYTWQAFVIQIPENVTHLSIEAAIRRSILIPDSITSTCVNFPKNTKDMFLAPNADDDDDDFDFDIDGEDDDEEGEDFEKDEDEDDEDGGDEDEDGDGEGKKKKTKMTKEGAAQKRELATKTAFSYFPKLASSDFLCLPKFIGGRVQHSNDIAGVYTVKLDTSL